jgi:hypothetical protein
MRCRADEVAEQVPYRACGRGTPANPDGLMPAAQIQLPDGDRVQATDRQHIDDY